MATLGLRHVSFVICRPQHHYKSAGGANLSKRTRLRPKKKLGWPSAYFCYEQVCIYLLGILEINLEVFFAPLDARVLVGGGVREAINLTRQAPDDAPEVGALAILAALRKEPKHTVN